MDANTVDQVVGHWLLIFLLANIAVAAFSPLLVLIHELGHAAAVVRTGRRAVVVVGQQPPLISLRLKHVDLHLHPRLPVDVVEKASGNGRYHRLGICLYDASDLTVGQLRRIAARGPHASAAAALAAAAGAWYAGDPATLPFWVGLLIAVAAWLDAVHNLRPFFDGRRPISDGARIEALRGLPKDFVPNPRPQHAAERPSVAPPSAPPPYSTA